MDHLLKPWYESPEAEKGEQYTHRVDKAVADFSSAPLS